MGFILSGAGILASILGLIWLKDRLESVRLQRLVYHEMTARLAVAGMVMIALGVLIEGSDLINSLGLFDEAE